MRILFWCEVFLPHVGGIQILVSQLVKALGKRGHACAIITNRHSPALPERETHHDATVYRLDGARDGAEFLRLCRQAQEIRREFRPGVNHMFFAGPLIMLLQMTNRAPAIPTLTSLQSPLPAALVKEGSAIKRLLEESRVLIAPSQQIRQQLVGLLPAARERVRWLPNAVAKPALAPAPLPFDPPVLLCLGRLVEEKGFDLAVRTLALLTGRGRQARMRVVGDGPERTRLEELARGLPVEFSDGVQHEKVPELINTTTLALMPSRWQEPFGMVVLDAALMARPVVATRVGGLSEVIEGGETGLLVEPENPAALADAIESLLRDPGRLRAMGEQARERVERLFSFEAGVESQIAWYEEALS